jgi:16S rRNA G966 N2-methylase RsmD
VIRLLRENVAALGLGERVTIVPGDALAPRHWGDPGERYGLVFFDSPYPMLDSGPARHAVFQALRELAAERLDEGGCIVFHAPAEKVQATEFDPRVSARLREYGTNAIWYLERVS